MEMAEKPFKSISMLGGNVELNITFPMKIEPKLRARQGRNGWYTPKKTCDCENLIKVYAEKALPPNFEVIKEKPISLQIMFCFLKTRSIPKNREYPIVRPDLDNYIKLLCDALNGVIWEDDGLIWNISAQKVYHDKDQVFLSIIY